MKLCFWLRVVTFAPGSSQGTEMNNRIVTILLLIVSMVGCNQSHAVQRANPAAVGCLEQGGVRVSVVTPEGTRTDCHLPDGTVVDEWTLFRRQHGAG